MLDVILFGVFALAAFGIGVDIGQIYPHGPKLPPGGHLVITKNTETDVPALKANIACVCLDSDNCFAEVER